MQPQNTANEPRRPRNVITDNRNDLHAAFAAEQHAGQGKPTRRLLQLSGALLDLLRFDLTAPGGEQLALDLYKLTRRGGRAWEEDTDRDRLHRFLHGLLFNVIKPPERDPEGAADYARIEAEHRAELAAWYATADETPASADDAAAPVVDINEWRSSRPPKIQNLLFAEKD